ncbi:MAG: glycosyltransferase [Bacteroidetes bacterium]|nr:glycosyltransferase [Bacteroidota bacterium]
MDILLVKNSVVPPLDYGGTERVVYWLAKSLKKLNHKVTILAAKGSVSDEIPIQIINPDIPLVQQIQPKFDIIHFHDPFKEELHTPYINTIHGVADPGETYHVNSVFVSSNQAKCHGASTFVYHGLDYSDYGTYDKNRKRTYLHFLAKTRWKIKNIGGAIDVAKKANRKLEVMGNQPVEKIVLQNILNSNVHFNGMIVGERKNEIMAGSMGLVFPTLCQETFGLSMFESMYHGCPVFGTPYGSLPELITSEVGFLSANSDELASQIKDHTYNMDHVHQYAVDLFSADRMAKDYLPIYGRVANGEKLHDKEPTYQADYLNRVFPFN